jgi:hypothetical protein
MHQGKEKGGLVINSFSVRMFFITTLIEISRNASTSKTHLGETYQSEKETIQSKVQKKCVGYCENTIDRKQITFV